MLFIDHPDLLLHLDLLTVVGIPIPQRFILMRFILEECVAVDHRSYVDPQAEGILFVGV